MLNVTKELTALARKLGYTGKAPDTVAKAINAITASVGEGGSEGGGGCDCEPGYEITETQLFSETVTTMDDGDGNYAVLDCDDTIDADNITVTFNGTSYECNRFRIDDHDESSDNDSYCYGGYDEEGYPDFTNYPFFIAVEGSETLIYTETAGTHNLVISTSAIETSADFDKAVAKASSASGNLPLVVEMVEIFEEENGDVFYYDYKNWDLTPGHEPERIYIDKDLLQIS